MKTFLAVTFFFRILIFKFAIGDDADDDGEDNNKCYDEQPIDNFGSEKFFENLKHTYVTHAWYGGRLSVCREFYFNKYSNGTIGYNYDFNGNGIQERGVKTYSVNCTGTEDREQNGKFSFNCTKTNDLDLVEVKKDLQKFYNQTEEVDEVVKKMTASNYKQEFPLIVTVLSTDYKEYALIHMCAQISFKGKNVFQDNFIVSNTNEDAGLPEDVKTKLEEYNLEGDKFDTREMCNKTKEMTK
ncbi:triafestin-2-like [Rhodnius prolixus]|uniref:triafestin-2-like n=1 Tax=Rhodnius prolixus TaxID=13249 RepID=UPI003D18A90A